MKTEILTFLIYILTSSLLLSQDPHRFDQAIQDFKSIPIPNEDNVAVFTGSSSIRFWKEVDQDCPQTYAINTGFGGSHMTDLLYFLEESVARFSPKEVYIYEGDNDIAAGKSTKEIMTTADLIVKKLTAEFPLIKIYFISAKPSPSRWSFQNKYLEFNTALKSYCNSAEQVHFLDV